MVRKIHSSLLGVRVALISILLAQFLFFFFFFVGANTPSDSLNCCQNYPDSCSGTFGGCSTGQYKKYNNPTCKNCLKGWRCPKTVSVNRFYCARRCGKGTYQDQTGQTSCKNCPVGKYNSGTTKTSLSDCLTCPAGRFCAAASQNYNTQCPAGKYCVAGTTTKPTCPTKHRCPTGTKSANQYPCKSGKYQSSTGQSSCLTCSAGTYSPNTASSSCTDCNAGSFSTSGSSSCTSCTAGKYQPSSKQASCLTCSAGTYSSSSGATSCADCNAGSFSTSGSSSCTTCTAGKYQPNSKQSSCLTCSAGTYSSSTGATSCANCNAGSFSAAEATSCTSCTAGKYQPNSKQSSCLTCSAGTYSSSSGSTSCTQCSGGRWCSAGSTNEDTLCAAGYYCPQGTSSQIKCPTGSYSSSTGRSAKSQCKKCTAGKACTVAGLTAPDANCLAGYYCTIGCKTNTGTAGILGGTGGVCPVGHYCPTGTKTSTEFPCAKGTYNSLQQQTSAAVCIDAPAGQYVASAGSSSITGFCNAGYYCLQKSFSPTSNQCPVGYYCPTGTKTSTEFPCPISTYNPNLQATSKQFCRNCSSGFYCNTVAAEHMTGVCAAGFFCNSTSCLDSKCSNKCNSASAGVEFNSTDPSENCLRKGGGVCPRGYICPLSSGSSVITTDNGTTLLHGAIMAIRCNSSSYAPNISSVSCILCGVGTAANRFRTACTTPSISMSNTKSNSLTESVSVTNSDSNSLRSPSFLENTISDSKSENATLPLTDTKNPSESQSTTQTIKLTESLETETLTSTKSSSPTKRSPSETESENITSTETKTITVTTTKTAATPSTSPTKSRSLQSKTTTHTFVPTPPRSKRNHPNEEITRIAQISGVVSAFVGAAAVAVQQGRLENAMQLAACGSGEYLVEELDFLSSPIAFEIGDQPLAYHRGAVIVNIGICIGCIVFLYAVAGIYAACTTTNFLGAQFLIRLPGALFIPFAITMGGGAEVSGSLILHGTSALDLFLGWANFVLLVLIPFGATAWVIYRSRVDTVCEPKEIIRAREKEKREQEEEESSGGINSKTATDTAAYSPSESLEQSLIMSSSSSGVFSENEEEGGENKNENENEEKKEEKEKAVVEEGYAGKTHCFARHCTLLYRFFRYLAVNHSEWRDINAEECIVGYDEDVMDDDDDDGHAPRREEVDVFTLKYSMVYEDYIAARFAMMELIVTFVLGWVAGASAGIMSRTACLMWLTVATIIIIVYTLVLIIAKPLLNRFLQGFMVISTLVSAATTVMALLQFLGEHLNYETSYLSLSAVQLIAGILATIMNFVGTGVVISQFFSAVRKGRRAIKSRSGGTRDHINFADLFANLDEEEIDLSILNEPTPATAVPELEEEPLLEIEEPDLDIELDELELEEEEIQFPDEEEELVVDLEEDDNQNVVPQNVYELEDDGADEEIVLDEDDEEGQSNESVKRKAEIANLEQLRELQSMLNKKNKK